MRYTLKYGRTENICIFVSLVVLDFSVSYIDSLEKNATLAIPGYGHLEQRYCALFIFVLPSGGEVWGKRNSCPAFQFISVIHLFIYCISAVLVTHILVYGPKSYVERRELNNEKPSVKLISSDFESLLGSTYVCDFISVE